MNYNFATFRNMGEKIVQGRKSKKMSQAAFIEALSAYNVQMGRNRLSKIENGVRDQFSLEFMIAVCDIFGWDMGYLLGEYEEQTKSVSDIRAVTGLSEPAVNRLMELKKVIDRDAAAGWTDTWDSRRIDTINLLLTVGIESLDCIYKCVFSAYTDFLLSGEYSKEISLCEVHPDGKIHGTPIDVSEMDGIFIIDLQRSVMHLRDFHGKRGGKNG